MMINKRMLQGLFTGIVLFLMSCGESEVQYVNDFQYSFRDNKVDLEVEFNPDFSLNTELSIPVLNFGTLSLIPNNADKGFKVRTQLSLDAFIDDKILHLDQTSDLPNGYPMSSYVETEVGELKFQASDKIRPTIYFGLEEDKFYLGASLELKFISEDFPAGLAMTQRIRDTLGRVLGVVTFYGPKVEFGEVVQPGGLFFISNVSVLSDYFKEQRLNDLHMSQHMDEPQRVTQGLKNHLMPEFKTEVNIKRFENKMEQFKLFKLYQREGKKAGMID